MNKRIALSIIASFITIIVIILIVSTATKIEKKKAITESIKILPDLDLKYLKRSTFDANKPTIVNLFSPSCEHCRYMTNELLLHKEEFSKSNFIMVSLSPIEEVTEFANEFNLSKCDFVSIGIDLSNGFYEKFGSTSVPSFYIYNRDKKLVKEIHGETKVSNIVNEVLKYN